ncbi:unnamed protein product [Leptosia nina]|uniref:Uncharacterized protein n=1 Tax=Leptosia nina TaxID=320188 RepID=A0AAV1JFJ2_9NEOP
MLMLNYMMFCSECARHPPCNFICLVLTVIGMSILVAAITCRIRTNLIFYAFIATAAVVFVCVLLACSSILIIELQTILGGRTVEIGESDYAIAAFMLYTSIIDLFLKIVQMLNLFDD